MEVNSNAREYEPRPAGHSMLAMGEGVLERLNVATSCSARKDDACRVAFILVVVTMMMMIVVNVVEMKMYFLAFLSEFCFQPRP